MLRNSAGERPHLSGRLEIELEIRRRCVSRGQLLVNEVGSPLLEVCIVRTLTAWTFPHPIRTP